MDSAPPWQLFESSAETSLHPRGRPRAHLLRRTSPDNGADPESSTTSLTEPDEDDATLIRCKRCGQHISDSGALTPIHGDAGNRVFSNPYGLIYELLTLVRAKGLSMVGPPSTEFAWFEGYAWEIAYCSSCHTHLGWQFTAQAQLSPPRFWGILRAEVVEG